MVTVTSRLVNLYSRWIGRVFLFIFPAGVIAGLIYFEIEAANAYSWLVDLAWYLFLANSLILAFNGVLVSLSFDGEVRGLIKEGTPINSAAGFRNLERKYKQSNLYLLIILFLAVIAYGFYAAAVHASDGIEALFALSEGNGKTLATYISISCTIFAIAASFIIRIPTLTGLNVGGLVKYYTASRHPYILDMMIYDGIYTLLDPITRVRFSQWSEHISKQIVPEFAPNLKPEANRKPLAIQNVLVLLYLNYRFPKIFDKEYLRRELQRIVPMSHTEEILKGEDLNLKVWKDIFSHLTKQTPELFLIIDRTILTLTETPELIEAKDFWVISAVPPTQKKEESQDIVFFILNRKDDSGEQKVLMNYKGADDLSPHDIDIGFSINAFDPFVAIPEDTSEFLSEDKRQLVRLVTAILFTGTCIWISAHSENIGSNLIALDMIVDDEPISTQIFNLRVVRDVRYYLQAWGPKVLASLAVLIPIVRALFGIL
ncbi:MAG: hypothetical protein GOP50_12630 [Candidatus Heimdallarchaeota archaeon]|nr:hypothetical protein [Candidatus Heimdallarchaeota archaeon]